MSLATFQLYRPFQDYDLETMPPATVKETMLLEKKEQAIPYLCMMLRARHRLDISCEQLAGL